MRITRVQAFHCDAGWRPWTFVKVDTDAGLVGWGECSDSRNPYGVAGSVRDLEDLRKQGISLVLLEMDLRDFNLFDTSVPIRNRARGGKGD